MYKLQLKKHIETCLDIEQIINNNWQIIENYDGTVSLFDDVLSNISSIIETKHADSELPEFPPVNQNSSVNALSITLISFSSSELFII